VIPEIRTMQIDEEQKNKPQRGQQENDTNQQLPFHGMQ
jgi:hypothetical protein